MTSKERILATRLEVAENSISYLLACNRGLQAEIKLLRDQPIMPVNKVVLRRVHHHEIVRLRTKEVVTASYNG
jgi:hypothetical protein